MNKKQELIFTHTIAYLRSVADKLEADMVHLKAMTQTDRFFKNLESWLNATNEDYRKANPYKEEEHEKNDRNKD